jgi:asparaginyl-tRNA synthetase
MRVRMRKLFASVNDYLDQEVTLMAWVRTNRAQSQFGFLSINDGTYFETLQVVYDNVLPNFEEISKFRVGVSVLVKGKVILTPQNKQPFEIHATEVQMLGDCPENYPIQPKRHTREFLRENAHLRPRTNLFSAVFRIRSVAAMGIHKYFQDNGYLYVHTPLITCADCEGSDQMFKISTLNLGSWFIMFSIVI